MKVVLDQAQFVFTPGAAGAGTIRFIPDLGSGLVVSLEMVQIVTNVTRNTVVYDFADPTLGEAAFDLATRTLTLAADTSSQSAGDSLQVIVEVPVDPYATNPAHGRDPRGNAVPVALTESGHAIQADGRYFVESRNRLGTVLQLDTTGFQTVSVQLTGTWAATVQFEGSNDGSTWYTVHGWWHSLAANSQINQMTGNGAVSIPAISRFVRLRVSAYTSGTVVASVVLRSTGSFLPWNIPSVSIGQIAALTLAAEDAAQITTPVPTGGIVRTALPPSTIVASDCIRTTYSRSGQTITKENALGDLDFAVSTTVTTSTQTAIRAAQGTDIRQSVTSVTFQNTNATATTLTIQDGSTTLVTFSVPASMTLPSQLSFPTPLRGTANTALNYTAGTTGASVLLTVTGFNSY